MILYLNGHWQEEHTAKISVLDRGFLFGDGVYEVTPIYHGQYFYLESHIQRLQQSLRLTGIDPQLTTENWMNIHHELLEKNQLDPTTHYQCYLQVSRGNDGHRHHRIRPETQPTVMAMIYPQTSQPDLQSIKLITQEDTRWSRCEIKSTSLLGNILLMNSAQQQGAQETILLREGFVTEAASANVFVVMNGVITTPQLSHHILPGVTRQIILDLATQLGIPHEGRDIKAEELKQASEIWITSSTRTLMPCHQLDEHHFQSPGPIAQSIQQAYRDLISQHCQRVYT